MTSLYSILHRLNCHKVILWLFLSLIQTSNGTSIYDRRDFFPQFPLNRHWQSLTYWNDKILYSQVYDTSSMSSQHIH